MTVHKSYEGTEDDAGIDVNQAMQQEPTLVSFGEWINGVEVASFSNASTSGTLALVNNGNGFADDLLTNFVSVAAGDSVYFTLNYTGANDGSEQFFLVNPKTVPEPATDALLLVGLGVLGLVAYRRREACTLAS